MRKSFLALSVVLVTCICYSNTKPNIKIVDVVKNTRVDRDLEEVRSKIKNYLQMVEKGDVDYSTETLGIVVDWTPVYFGIDDTLIVLGRIETIVLSKDGNQDLLNKLKRRLGSFTRLSGTPMVEKARHTQAMYESASLDFVESLLDHYSYDYGRFDSLSIADSVLGYPYETQKIKADILRADLIRQLSGTDRLTELEEIIQGLGDTQISMEERAFVMKMNKRFRMGLDRGKEYPEKDVLIVSLCDALDEMVAMRDK